MVYSAIVDMANSASLRSRVAAAAAAEGASDPEQWARANIWRIAASPDWATDWAYAVDTATVNVNPDTGARIDVISDADILAAVQAVMMPPAE